MKKINRSSKYVAIFIFGVFVSLALMCFRFPSVLSDKEPVDLVELRKTTERGDPRTIAHVEALKKNASRGDAQSQIQLGDLYYEGRWVERDIEKAIEWYLEAAEQGDLQAELKLADTYDRYNHSVNYPKYVAWLKKAAEHNDARSQARLGSMYEFGEKGLEKDPVTAYFWYKKGLNDLELKNKLFIMKISPEQIEEGERMAAEWQPVLPKLREGDREDLAHVPDLPEYVSMGLLSDKECKKAPSEFEYMRLMAEDGDAPIQLNLAQKYYETGEYEQAVKWTRKSAELGYEAAQSLMGRLYAPNIGEISMYGYEHDMEYGNRHAAQYAKNVNMEPDYQEAAKWFELAAEQDDKASQYFLALLYDQGLGVEQNYEQAYFWFSLAMSRMREGTAQYNRYEGLLDKIGDHLSSEKIEEVRTRANEWKPTYNKPKRSELGWNIEGILCGKYYGDCKLTEAWGDIVKYDCGFSTDRPFYHIDKRRKKVIRSCSVWNGPSMCRTIQ